MTEELSIEEKIEIIENQITTIQESIDRLRYDVLQYIKYISKIQDYIIDLQKTQTHQMEVLKLLHEQVSK